MYPIASFPIWLKVFAKENPEAYAVHALKSVLFKGAALGDIAGEAAGLAPGDIIVEIDKKTVDNLKTFDRLLTGVKHGDTILFLIDRGGTTIFVKLNVKEWLTCAVDFRNSRQLISLTGTIIKSYH